MASRRHAFVVLVVTGVIVAYGRSTPLFDLWLVVVFSRTVGCTLDLGLCNSVHQVHGYVITYHEICLFLCLFCSLNFSGGWLIGSSLAATHRSNGSMVTRGDRALQAAWVLTLFQVSHWLGHTR